MWKGWGKKEAGEVEPGFYIKDHGNHLEGFCSDGFRKVTDCSLVKVCS